MRYIPNRFVDDEEAGARGVSDEWIIERIEELVPQVMKEAFDVETLSDAGPYVGASGYVLALLEAMPFIRNRRDVEKTVDKILAETRKANPPRSAAKEVRFLSGHLGLYSICELRARDEALEKRIRATGEAASHLDFQWDEIFVGRAGFLASALFLSERVSPSIVDDMSIRAVIRAIIRSGRDYARLHRSRFPLMFNYHGTEYLGAAHGLACILHFLLCFSHLLDPNDLADVRASADQLVSLQDDRGNFSSSLREGEPKRKREEDELVHWCHGAPGVAFLLALTYLKFHDQRYFDALLAAGDAVWKRGVLKKGPGICHGVAGSGFVFLLIYRVTRDRKWLLRARTFARFLYDEAVRREQRTPDRPWSLFEGWAGALCFLSALLRPHEAQFPLFIIPNSLFPH